MEKIIMLSLMLISLGILLANAQELARYDFDEIEVIYAAEFVAKPVSANPNNWLVQVAGGTDKPITAIYGVVNLKKQGKTEIVEEFIKVEGEGGSERFLLNSFSLHFGAELNFPISGESLYEADITSLKEAGKFDIGGRAIDKSFSGDSKSFFWSAKKIVGFDLIKDFTPPIKSASLYLRFDKGQRYSILLSAPEAGEKDKQNIAGVSPPAEGAIKQIIKEGEPCDVADINEIIACFNYCNSIGKNHSLCREEFCKCFEKIEDITQPSAKEIQKEPTISLPPTIKEGDPCTPQTPSDVTLPSDVIACLSYCNSIGINQATCNEGVCRCVKTTDTQPSTIGQEQPSTTGQDIG